MSQALERKKLRDLLFEEFAFAEAQIPSIKQALSSNVSPNMRFNVASGARFVTHHWQMRNNGLDLAVKVPHFATIQKWTKSDRDQWLKSQIKIDRIAREESDSILPPQFCVPWDLPTSSGFSGYGMFIVQPWVAMITFAQWGNPTLGAEFLEGCWLPIDHYLERSKKLLADHLVEFRDVPQIGICMKVPLLVDLSDCQSFRQL